LKERAEVKTVEKYMHKYSGDIFNILAEIKGIPIKKKR